MKAPPYSPVTGSLEVPECIPVDLREGRVSLVVLGLGAVLNVAMSAALTGLVFAAVVAALLGCLGLVVAVWLLPTALVTDEWFDALGPIGRLAVMAGLAAWTAFLIGLIAGVMEATRTPAKAPTSPASRAAVAPKVANAPLKPARRTRVDVGEA